MRKVTEREGGCWDKEARAKLEADEETGRRLRQSIIGSPSNQTHNQLVLPVMGLHSMSDKDDLMQLMVRANLILLGITFLCQEFQKDCLVWLLYSFQTVWIMRISEWHDRGWCG